VFTRYFLLLTIAFSLSGLALAQPDPANPQPVKPPAAQQPKGLEVLLAELIKEGMRLQAQPAQVTPAAQALYVYRHGTLAKYDPNMQLVKAVELFGPMPGPAGAVPTEPEKQKLFLETLKRIVPAAITVQRERIIISVGDQFFVLDAETLEKKVDANIAGDLQPLQQLERLPSLLQPPALTVGEKSVMLSRGNKLTIISLADGKVQKTVELPPSMNLNPFQPGKPIAAGDKPAPRDITVVGAIVRHPEITDWQCWTVRDDEGAEYVLTGEQAKTIAAKGNPEGQRFRITGTLITEWAALPKFAKGLLTVKTAQAL